MRCFRLLLCTLSLFVLLCGAAWADTVNTGTVAHTGADNTTPGSTPPPTVDEPGNYSNQGDLSVYGGQSLAPGSSSWSYGGTALQVGGAFNNSGTLNAFGGAGSNMERSNGGYGIYVGGDFTNSNTITAQGGVGGSADIAFGGDGIYVEGNFTNNNTLTATGGNGGSAEVALGGNGIVVLGNFTNNSSITAQGGQGGSDREAGGGSGIYVEGSFTNSGSITAQGGMGGQSGQGGYGGTGISVDHGFTNSGTITATGGNGGSQDAQGGYGIFVNGHFTNSGSITAQGGNGGSAMFARGGYGIFVNLGDFINSGSITATGGQGGSAYSSTGGHGIYTDFGDFINSGTLSAQGGVGGSYATFIQDEGSHGGYGISVGGNFTNSGTLTAQGGNGGSGVNAWGGQGISAEGDFTNSGSITAQGGNGGSAQSAHGGHGIAIGGDFTNSGTITAQGGNGGSAQSAHGGNGIAIGGDFTNSGSITATGGNGGSAQSAFGRQGISVSGDFTNSGSISTQGGNGGSAQSALGGHGISVSGDFTNSGTITATGGNGGSGVGALAGDGIFVTGNVTNSGILIAQGGENPVGEVSYGLFTHSDFTATAGALTVLARGSDALANYQHSIITYGQALFEAGSQLMWGMGSIELFDSFSPSTPGFQFDPGAELSLQNAMNMAPGDNVNYLLVTRDTSAAGAPINTPGQILTPTWQHDFTDDGTDLYVTSTRLADLSTYTETENAAALFGALESSNGGQLAVHADTYDYWSMLYAYVDGAATESDMRERANTVARGATPQGTSQIPGLLLNQQRLAREVLNTNMAAAAAQYRLNPTLLPAPPSTQYSRTAANAAVGNFATAAGPEAGFRYTIWAQPFHHRGTQDAVNAGFTDMDQRFTGISAGATINLNNTPDSPILGLAAHYASARLSGDGYHADGDSLGLQAALGKRFSIDSTWQPWVQIHAGYTWQSFEQHRRDFLNARFDSEPDAHLFSLGGLVSNDFVLGPVALTPRLGLDYSFISLESYAESGIGGLHVKADDQHSLNATVGASARWQVAAPLALTARAFYRYEFLDAEAKMKSSISGLPGVNFTTKSPDVNGHSGQFGLGLELRGTENFSFGLDYDLWLAEKYTGHQFGAFFKFEF